MTVAPANRMSEVAVRTLTRAGYCVLTAEGCLDATTYLPLRDAIIKAAIDAPSVIIADVSKLSVPAPTAWMVFTSARWHIAQWPDVPIILVCPDAESRQAIENSGVTRWVPVYANVSEAVAAQVKWFDTPVRRRFFAELPRSSDSLARSRRLMEEWLTCWGRTELISVAKLVVTVFVENVLAHTESAPIVRLETKDDIVTVAVGDQSSHPAARREDPVHGSADVAGLSIVAALCRSWGSAPTTSGKTVWAALGPENRLGDE